MSTESKNLLVTYGNFMKEAKAKRAASEALYKSATDEEAMSGIKDPNCKGKVSIPGFGDGANRSALGIPPMPANNGTTAGRELDLCTVSTPSGTGQGSYITPKDGDAKDKAATSPTTPLSKIAANSKNLKAAIAALNGHAPADVDLPRSLTQETDLMSKLASVAAVMLSTEEGRRYAQEVLEKEAGMQEAYNIMNQVNEELYNQAYASQAMAIPYGEFRKQAAITNTHYQWLAACGSDMEKLAYAQGAADGEAAADAMVEGDEPDIPGAEPTAEDLMECLQELVAAGEVAPEEAEAILGALGEAADDGISGEELAAVLEEGVTSGQISPEQAEAIAEAFMTDAMGGEMPVQPEEAEAAAAAAEQDPVAAAAADESVTKAASVMQYLWN